MDWSKPYSSYWRVFRVNKKTWADAEQISGIDTATIEKTANDDLLESGSMDITADTFETGYYRIVMTAEQDGGAERVEIATLLFESTSGTRDYGRETKTAEGHSVLYPASCFLLSEGSYASSGIDGAQYVAGLLSSVVNAPIVCDGSFTLNESVVHSFGCSVLEAAWSVLDAGNFIMRITGNGEIHILPKPNEATTVFDAASANLLMAGVDHSCDYSELPNRYIAKNGDYIVTVVNNNLDSPISYPKRGWYKDVIDDSPTLVNGESLEQYAEKKLTELSVGREELVYTREWIENLYPYDVIKGSIESAGFDGNMRIVSQSIDCNSRILVSEKAEQEVLLWEK